MNAAVQGLVDRLLQDGVQLWWGPEKTFHGDPLSQEAAACITSLSQLNERMAKALEPLVRVANDLDKYIDLDELRCGDEEFISDASYEHITVGDCRTARTAIAGLAAPPADSKPGAEAIALLTEIYKAACGLTLLIPQEMVGRYRDKDDKFVAFDMHDWKKRAKAALERIPKQEGG